MYENLIIASFNLINMQKNGNMNNLLRYNKFKIKIIINKIFIEIKISL